MLVFLREGSTNIQIMVAELINSYNNDGIIESDVLMKVLKKSDSPSIFMYYI